MIERLGRELVAARLRYANLLAAARATLAAAREGDPHALEFLSDELVVQHGQHDLDGPGPFERARPAQWWEVGR